MAFGAEDRDQIAQIVVAAIEHHQLNCPIREIGQKTDENTKGVNNFRAFQLDTTKKIGFIHGAVKVAAWVSGVLGALFVAVSSWALTVIVPAAKIVVDEYYHEHPAAITPHKSVAAPLRGVYTVRMAPPHAVAGKDW